MNEEALNISLRKFLKKVGVTSQREIEGAIRSAHENGALAEGPLKATVHLTLEGVALDITIDGQIDLD